MLDAKIEKWHRVPAGLLKVLEFAPASEYSATHC
jgi:hypothetical protein